MSPAPIGRESAEIEALVTDRYLESLLAAQAGGADRVPAPSGLDPEIRDLADRLARSLPRVHPSFRFEEALSARLAALALSRRLPNAAGAEGTLIPLPARGVPVDPKLEAYLPEAGDSVRPLIIGGALTSAAISIAGAAYVAWRRRNRPPATPMARAVRAVARGRLD